MNTALVEALFQAVSALSLEERSLLEEKLQTQKQRQEPQNPEPNAPPEDFIGMWRDRPDMQDSTQWVRTLRQQQWGTQ